MIKPGDFVLVDQFIDRTRNRASTFFDDFDMVAHVAFGDPVDRALLEAVRDAAAATPACRCTSAARTCAWRGRSSRRAPSPSCIAASARRVIGMTNLPEAKLAREAELPYATLAMVTDYDCWHQSEEAVTVEAVIKVLMANVEKARAVIRALAPRLPDASRSPASSALQNAILTAPALISAEDAQGARPADRQVPEVADRPAAAGGLASALRCSSACAGDLGARFAHTACSNSSSVTRPASLSARM